MAQSKSTTQAVVSVLVLIGGIWYWFGGGLERQTAKNMDDIYTKVANDAVAQYEMTKRNGSAIDVCVHAGLVSAAYLQAKDEENYKKWKAVETRDCANR